MKADINVIGLGYIGLPTALMFAANGKRVVGSDNNMALVEKLRQGELALQEEGFEEIFLKARENGIVFQEAYAQADVYIVAVPTPYDKKNKKLDPQYVINATKQVVEICEEGAVIVVESTISPGTIDKCVRPLLKKGVHIAHAPERIIPGRMIAELKENARIIGADSEEIGKKIKTLYASFCKNEIAVVNIRTAEMTKVVENTYRDINIAFANEMAKICRSDNLDVYEIIRLANKHPRVDILSPGPGVGGHCISVDPWFLVGDYPGLANIVLAARKINDSMPAFVLGRAHEIMKKNGILDVSNVGLYGLTYKEDVDDVRESPSLQLLDEMDRHLAGRSIKVYDPYVQANIVANQYHDLNAFLRDIQMVIIMVGHEELKKNMEKLNGKVIFDTKNICNIEGTYKL